MRRSHNHHVGRSAGRLFTPVPERVSSARSFVRATLAEWDIDCPEAVAVVSELASNAVRYGAPSEADITDRAPFAVTILAGARRLRLEVHDQNPALPRMRPLSSESSGGRGLHIVEAYAASWGAEVQVGRGKCVWAEVRLLPAPEPGHDRPSSRV
jgi:anti-sigma regulatory factor (Ser/Thr protein kinase)